jgi:hypothetical protein
MQHRVQTMGLLSLSHKPFDLCDDPVRILLNIDDVVGVFTCDERFQVADLGIEEWLNSRDLCGLPHSFDKFVPRT